MLHSVMVEQMGKVVKVEQLHCLRCDHFWWPRLNEKGKSVLPKNCPYCKSPYWDKPIERQTVSDARKKQKI